MQLFDLNRDPSILPKNPSIITRNNIASKSVRIVVPRGTFESRMLYRLGWPVLFGK